MLRNGYNVAVMALCCLLLNACCAAEPSPRLLEREAAQVRQYGYVAANAFRVANPEYKVRGGGEAAVRSIGEMAIQVDVEPNWRLESFASDDKIVAIRRDGDVGRIYYSRPVNRVP